MAQPSLRRRLLLAVFSVIVVFFALTIFLLDMLFRRAAERGLHEVLDAQMVALVAAADPDGPESVTPTALLDTRFDTPGSGLYAEIRSASGETHLALAVHHRHRRAVRTAARGRRTAVPLHPDRRQRRATGGRQPRHRLGRPAWPIGAIHLQRRLESRDLRRADRELPAAAGRLVRRPGAAAAAHAHAGRCAGCRSRCAGWSARSRKWKRARASSSASDWPQRAERRHQQPQCAARVANASASSVIATRSATSRTA